MATRRSKKLGRVRAMISGVISVSGESLTNQEGDRDGGDDAAGHREHGAAHGREVKDAERETHQHDRPHEGRDPGMAPMMTAGEDSRRAEAVANGAGHEPP